MRGETDVPRATRGQSEVLGVVLLLVVVVAGIVAVVSLGSGSLADARGSTELERGEHTMAVLDARASAVALGASDARTVEVPAGGQYDVDPDAGWIRVRHLGYDGANNETVYNGTLGAVRYRHGDTTIVYQGGGVWRADPGGTRMVSPPEFHYRDATLTLPVVRVDGDAHVAGNSRLTVRGTGPVRVFPDDDTAGPPGPGAPYDATGEPYHNVIADGRVTVTVHSDHYEAWAAFFRSRTDANVTVDHAATTVTLELTARGTFGRFDMPAEGNAVELRGIERDHAVGNFTVVLAPDDADAAKFNNLQWSLHAESGSREFEVHLRKSGEFVDPTALCDRETVSATVYFSDTNGADYHGWHEEDAFVTDCVDRDGDGIADEARLVANLTDAVPLASTELSSSQLHHYNPSGGSHLDPVTLEGHGDWEPATYDAGDTERLDHLLNHYVALMAPNVALTVDDKSSDTINEEESYGVIRYDGRGKVVFLHLSEHTVRVTAD